MKNVILPLRIIIPVLVIFSCSNGDQNKEKIKGIDIEKALAQFAKSHNAISNIEKLIFPDNRDPFMFEIEKYINEKHDHLFLVKGTLEDIISSKGDYILQVHGFSWLSLVYFRMSADDTLVSKLLSDGIQKYDDIAVIVQLRRVQKLAFEVLPKKEELDISSSHTLVFYGECKAYMKIH